MSVWNSIKQAAAGTMAVCDECLRPDENVVSRTQFDDYAVCPRCGQSKNSNDRANRVKRGGEFPHGKGCCS